MTFKDVAYPTEVKELIETAKREWLEVAVLKRGGQLTEFHTSSVPELTEGLQLALQNFLSAESRGEPTLHLYVNCGRIGASPTKEKPLLSIEATWEALVGRRYKMNPTPSFPFSMTIRPQGAAPITVLVTPKPRDSVAVDVSFLFEKPRGDKPIPKEGDIIILVYAEHADQHTPFGIFYGNLSTDYSEAIFDSQSKCPALGRSLEDGGLYVVGAANAIVYCNSGIGTAPTLNQRDGKPTTDSPQITRAQSSELTSQSYVPAAPRNPLFAPIKRLFTPISQVPDERTVWYRDLTRGAINKHVVVEERITNIRIFQHNVETGQFVQVALKDQLDAVVLNARRDSQSMGGGSFVYSGMGAYMGYRTGVSQTVGDVTILKEGKILMTLKNVAHPSGVKQLINTIKREMKNANS
jgi:hypothetical protein